MPNNLLTQGIGIGIAVFGIYFTAFAIVSLVEALKFNRKELEFVEKESKKQRKRDIAVKTKDVFLCFHKFKKSNSETNKNALEKARAAFLLACSAEKGEIEVDEMFCESVELLETQLKKLIGVTENLSEASGTIENRIEAQNKEIEEQEEKIKILEQAFCFKKTGKTAIKENIWNSKERRQ